MGGAGKFFQKWGRRCRPRRRRLVDLFAVERRRANGFSSVDIGVKILVFGILCGVLKCEGRLIVVVIGGCLGRLSSVSSRFFVLE